jgi:hypothetical protein
MMTEPTAEDRVREAREVAMYAWGLDYKPTSLTDGFGGFEAGYDTAVRDTEARYAALVEAMETVKLALYAIVADTNADLPRGNTSGYVTPGQKANAVARGALRALANVPNVTDESPSRLESREADLTASAPSEETVDG